MLCNAVCCRCTDDIPLWLWPLIRGRKGEDGREGVMGRKGEAGMRGDAGSPGIPGSGIGEKGDRGKQGHAGIHVSCPYRYCVISLVYT